MEDEAFTQDAFRTDNLWQSSSFFKDALDTSLFHPIELDVPLIKLDNPYAPTKQLNVELQLPDIDLFQFGPLPELESLDQSTIESEPESLQLEEDIWKIALGLGPANKDVVFYTWEGFENLGTVEPRSAYIGEAGPGAFDTALALKADGPKRAGRILKSDILLNSLINLGLGRSSILFNYEAKRKTFVQAIDDGRTSGISLRTAQSLIQFFVHTGNTFLRLRSFVQKTYVSRDSLPARVALASITSSILSTLEDYVGHKTEEAKSILQLQRLFIKPHDILLHVAGLVETARLAHTNEEFASILYHCILSTEQGDEGLYALSTEILSRVAMPSLEVIGEWIGLRDENSAVPITSQAGWVALGDVSDDEGPREYQYNEDLMPHFISEEDGRTIFETGISLRFLRTHHSEHPLTAVQRTGIQAPELKWKFEWQTFEDIFEKAKAYEDGLRLTIQKVRDASAEPKQHKHGEVAQKEPPDQALGSDFERYLQESAQLFDNAPKPTFNDLPDELHSLLESLLLNEPKQSDEPPLSLTPRLSFGPILAAQARIINATALHLFFHSHQLRTHLLLQRQYHLFGDGVFSSRLASALFDPERETAERHKGTIRSGVQMGLQLGSRTTWPPASSELRLALMGVLSESYYASQLYYSTLKEGEGEASSLRDHQELPGQLNFAIRNLTEPEMDKVMDPNSLYALDFLRLQYVPPPPLNLVITSASLEKYDYIFKFLLRLTRMLFVVSHLPRTYPDPESRHFRNEAHHFVTVLSTYIFQTGISEPWDVFQSFIDSVEQRLQADDAAGELGVRVREGLESIKSAHERCLDGIMFSLLLRRRQKKVMALLEEILDLILAFSKRQADGEETGDVKDMYARFKGKIRVFISVCRGLTGKKGYGKGRGTTEENTIERLLVLLEMNGYYAS